MAREHHERMRCHQSTQLPYPEQLSNSELKAHNAMIDEYYKEFSISAFEQADNHKPDSTLIKQQPQLTSDYRSPLLDFLFKMSKRTRVCPSIYYRSVKLIDRYCSKRIVLLEQAQLVATTCLWVVAKTDGGCNHCYPSTGGRFDGPTMRARIPRLSELCQLCGPSCSYDEGMFVQMERHILDTLNWQVTEPGIDEWCLDILDYNHNANKDKVQLKQFIIDCSLYSEELISTHPAELASSVIDVFNTINSRLSPTLILSHQKFQTKLVLPTLNLDITEKLLTCITKSTETIITNYSQLTSAELIKNFIQESHYYLTSIQKSKIRSLSASSSLSSSSYTYYDSEEDLSDTDSLFDHIVNHSMNFQGSRTPSPIPSPDKLVFNKIVKNQHNTLSPLSRSTSSNRTRNYHM